MKSIDKYFDFFSTILLAIIVIAIAFTIPPVLVLVYREAFQVGCK